MSEKESYKNKLSELMNTPKKCTACGKEIKGAPKEKENPYMRIYCKKCFKEVGQALSD